MVVEIAMDMVAQVHGVMEEAMVMAMEDPITVLVKISSYLI